VSSRVETDPDPADVAFLEARINDITQQRVGGEAPLELALFVRDGSGAITAGTYGWTWGSTCELHHLWVDESLRGTGIGTELLAEAEAEATRRGCRQITFFTHTFQAGHFYRDRGYELVGRVEDYPDGDAALWLRKPLDPG
jgi:GNAT superfamily N-acetyltransferase